MHFIIRSKQNFKRVGTVLILGILLIPIQRTRNSVNQEGIKDWKKQHESTVFWREERK